jgi:hypothetical protein
MFLIGHHGRKIHWSQNVKAGVLKSYKNISRNSFSVRMLDEPVDVIIARFLVCVNRKTEAHI